VGSTATVCPIIGKRHARRSDAPPGEAEEALQYIRKLYKVERAVARAPPQQVRWVWWIG
jgi:hypothetical protein